VCGLINSSLFIACLQCSRALLLYTVDSWRRAICREVLDLRPWDRTSACCRQFFMSAVCDTQDRRALYLADARRMPPRPSRVLQAPSADRDQDDRCRAQGASIRYRWAATAAAWTGGCTDCRRLSSLPLPLSNAFSDSLFFDKFSLIPINAVAVERRRAFDNNGSPLIGQLLPVL